MSDFFKVWVAFAQANDSDSELNKHFEQLVMARTKVTILDGSEKLLGSSKDSQ